MAYSADSFVADEQPTTAKWNKLWTNDASFNDGTGIADDALLARHYAAGSVDAPARSQVVKAGRFTISATGSKVITGVGFQPKAVLFLDNLASSGSAATGSYGIADGTIQGAASWGANASAESREGSEALCVLVQGNADNLQVQAALTSLDADGFTLNVTQADSARTIMYLAFA